MQILHPLELLICPICKIIEVFILQIKVKSLVI